jgi:hypothetical protein
LSAAAAHVPIVRQTPSRPAFLTGVPWTTSHGPIRIRQPRGRGNDMRMIFGSVVIGLLLWGAVEWAIGDTAAWLAAGVWATICVLFIGVSIRQGTFE